MNKNAQLVISLSIFTVIVLSPSTAGAQSNRSIQKLSDKEIELKISDTGTSKADRQQLLEEYDRRYPGTTANRMRSILSADQKRVIAKSLSDEELEEHIHAAETTKEGKEILLSEHDRRSAIEGSPLNKKKKMMAEISNQHPEWSEAIIANIVEKKVLIGMTKEQVLAAWGKPRRSSEDRYAGSSTDLWIYVRSSTDEQSLYFVNDSLQAVNNYNG